MNERWLTGDAYKLACDDMLERGLLLPEAGVDIGLTVFDGYDYSDKDPYEAVISTPAAIAKYGLPSCYSEC